MNETLQYDSVSDVTWTTSDHRMRVPDTVRTTVRGNPLVAVAVAVTLGAVIARITR